MSNLAVTVLGPDRPGIIAAATAGLAGLGLNLEDCTMTLLRGHFAMVLVTAGEVSPDQVERGLAQMSENGLTVTVRELPATGPTLVATSAPYVVTVHGADRPGIVSAVAGEVARVGGNITDLATRLAGDLYLLIAELDLPADADPDALAAAIAAVAEELGVHASLRPADADEL